MALSPFDYLNSITYNKNILEIDDYNQFMVSRGLSHFPDTVHFAAEISQYGNVYDRLHYDFLRHAIPARRRFSKWAKAVPGDIRVDSIKEYYACSQRHAEEIINTLTEKQVDLIVKFMNS